MAPDNACDSKLEERVTQSRRKKRGPNNENLELWQTTEAELQQLNERWLYWAEQLKPALKKYANGDEDLIQEGILYLRETLLEDINHNAGILLYRARLAISRARYRGVSVDSPKRRDELVYIDELEDPDTFLIEP